MSNHDIETNRHAKSSTGHRIVHWNSNGEGKGYSGVEAAAAAAAGALMVILLEKVGHIAAAWVHNTFFREDGEPKMKYGYYREFEEDSEECKAFQQMFLSNSSSRSFQVSQSSYKKMI